MSTSPSSAIPATPVSAPAPLIDPYARRISYLRVSVTDRCDLRCRYCMAEDMTFLPKSDLLTLEEIERLCRTFVRLGVTKLRLTGGEPLVRKNIMWLIERLGRLLNEDGLEELTLTTNGNLLSHHAQALFDNGVRRLNVSLDSLDETKFAHITRWGKLNTVLAGLDAAVHAGLKIKINMVALRDVNEDECDDMIAWCGERGFDLTFIEVMPMGDIGNEQRLDQYLPLSLLRTRLEQNWTLKDSTHRSGGPARYVSVAETGGRLGFITPMTHNFCESCNRVRLDCTGILHMCLGQEDAADLRTPLRSQCDDATLRAAVRHAIARKPKGHDFVMDRRRPTPSVSRHMSATGG